MPFRFHPSNLRQLVREDPRTTWNQPIALRHPLQASSYENLHQIDSRKMALPRWAVPLVLALLMIDAIIEMAFISSMVRWLHYTAGGQFEVIVPDSQDKMSFSLHGKPKNLLTNQGHTSNGAAGTAFVLVGFGGILVLTLRHRASTNSKWAKHVSNIYVAWLVSTVLTALLTLAALAYTFSVTAATRGQSVDIATAASLDNRPYPNYVAYPKDDWTPETWFEAVLKLMLVDSSQRSDIEHHLTIMRAWKWNLIPLFLLGLTLSAVAVLEAWSERRNDKIVRGDKFEPVRGHEQAA
jgi:hypothetical protein